MVLLALFYGRTLAAAISTITATAAVAAVLVPML